MNYGWIPILFYTFTQILAVKDLEQLEFDDFSDLRESAAFFEGVQPLSYFINLELPMEIDKINKKQSLPQYGTKGSISLIFRWTPKSGIFQIQRSLALHSKFLKIRQNSVQIWQLQHLTGIKQNQLNVENVIVDDVEEMISIRLKEEDRLKMGETYRLDIGEFEGRVEDEGSKNGIFLTSPGLATQFQLNDARRAFPCVDLPGKKAVFTLALVHPSAYIALSNMEMDIGGTGPIEKMEGWTKTTFRTTPLMSTYILAFTLIPKTFVEKASLTWTTSNGVRISLFYNPDRFTDTDRTAALAKFSREVYDQLQGTFSPRLPLSKLDVSIVKGLSILGMENWGLVNLREEFVIKENEIEQFGLLAHEFVHQWMGDLATTMDWKHLCVQEGLTEHYARRTLADFYGGPTNTNYQRYIFVRYLPAVQNETNNVHLKPIRQDFQGFDEAVAYCFGRVPFVWTMIERIVGGRRIFDGMINRFLTDYSYKSFVLDDLTSYLNRADAADILKFYVDHGGYPSLFVNRKNDTVYHLRQRQIVPLAPDTNDKSAIFQVPSLKDPWPIPLSTTQGERVVWTSEYDLAVNLMPIDRRGVPLLNPDFAYFYRVNYDGDTWKRIVDALVAFPREYTEVTRAQFVNDFCFFRGLNLIEKPSDGDDTTLNILTKRFLQVQRQLELDTNIFVRFYTKGC